MKAPEKAIDESYRILDEDECRMIGWNARAVPPESGRAEPQTQTSRVEKHFQPSPSLRGE
jgi:hypothetical protein